MLENILKDLLNNPLYKKYQLFILPVVTVAISIILVLIVDVPQIFQILNDEKVLAETNDKYQRLQNKLITLQKVDTVSYRTKINTALTAIPPEKDIPGALGQALYFISSNNLRLDGITISNIADTVGGSSNGTYLIRVEVTGSVDNLRAFTQKIKEAPRVMKVTGLEIAESKGANNLQATLTLTVYYQPLPTTIGAVNQDLSPLSSQEEAVISKIESYLRNTPSSTSSSGLNIGKIDPFQ